MRRFLRPIPIGLGVLALALLVPVSPAVVSALTGKPVPGVSLHHGLAYLLLAPLGGVWDWLTTRTVEEHRAVVALLAVGFLVWRALRPRRRRSLGARVALEVASALAVLLGLLAFYAYGAVGPRPMAALRVEDPDVVVVDLHSHTDASHDGRPGFDAEANRAWHAGAGFDLAWITDHDHIEPALAAMERNPVRAGDGVSLLPGREVVYAEQHVVALGLWDPRRGPPSTSLPDRGSSSPGSPGPDCSAWPLLIQTLPNDLGRVHTGACTGDGAGVVAIELVDGDPRGFGQGERERARLLAVADSLGLTLVSASNLHGWGRTAVAWNLVRVPGWRTMTPEAVGRRVEEAVRKGTVQVVTVRPPARTAAGPGEAALAPAARTVEFLASRCRGERVAWLVWAALFWGVVLRPGGVPPESSGSSRTGAARRSPSP